MSSTLRELAPERAAVRAAIEGLRFTPVLFELGARPHPPRALYRAYLEQSDVFVAIYWQSYGWVAPGMEVSGLEDEYVLAGPKPKLVYVKSPAGEREPGLQALLGRISTDEVSYRRFETASELAELVADDLALLVSESFTQRLDAGRGRVVSLPAPASSFVGREREVEGVVELLRRRDIRLLTLTGPGGIGKTRLALEAAHRVSSELSSDIVFVPLGALAEPAAVVPAIQQAVGIPGDGTTPAAELLHAHLATRELLLVLDNMEHLLESGRMVADLLAAAPGLRVLVTSRVRLDVSGENLFQVPPMSVPEPGEREADTIERSDAVRLFEARAQAAGWTTTSADAAIVADLVRRLDGLPLAIELAAAQARLVPAELVHTRLRRRLDLGGGPRDAEERHRTLRSTIAWSYDLIDEPARRFFEALAVFSAGFTLDSAAAVAEEGEDAEGLLASLVDASLVTTGPSPVTGVRFGMLETIREYAAERLDERGARPEVAARHLAYFAQLADDAYDAGPLDPSARVRLDEERENLRAAYWEAMGSSPTEAVRLAGGLGTFFTRRGLNREGREALVRALDAAPEAPAEWRARALLQLGWLAAEADECEEADRRAEEALELYRALGDKRGIGASFNTLGYSAATREDPDRAVGFYEEAYRAFAEGDLVALRRYAAVNLATVLTAQGQIDEARRLYVEALDFFVPHGFEDEAATVQFRLGELDEDARDLAAARRQFDGSAATARRLGNRRLLAWALMRLGHVDATEGRSALASASFAEALELHVELGQPSGAATCLEYAARAARGNERWEAAAGLLGAARARREQTGVPVPESEEPHVSATEAELRKRLGDERFEQEVAAGAELDVTGLLALFETAPSIPSATP